MTSTTNASATLADALAQFSKTAYSAFTEIENQSRLEVLCAMSETREAREETREAREETRQARIECDKVARDLHAATLEAQGWKQAAADAKTTLGQTIAHQVENIESQHQTIAELRREVTQWKDQSRNWQEHFLRVEQERCAQSSRIDELLKLQPAASSSQEPDPQTPAASRTTLIRRVQAVIHVKREESDDDSAEDLSAITNMVKDDASDKDGFVRANQRRSSRRTRKIIDDDDDIEQHYLAADGNPVSELRHLRHRSAVVNYREEEEDDDDDELMMGAEENHEEVYGIETLRAQRSKQQRPHPNKVAAPSPKKKRKLAAR